MVPPKRKPKDHLINILRATRDHHPNFALFLGAGASASSGVRMAGEMIKEWRQTAFNMYSDTIDIESWLKTQMWYQATNEYSVLFELLYDQPSQRREYIETCIEGAKPSWGYIYLVNLLKNRIFDTVFTTNFDDLITEACYMYNSNLKPIICSHDSSIKSVRITSKRPKVVKLHGDFLFDDIKNTVSELESLEENTKNKFKQFASEYGVIFVGYSGNDRSVMDTLNVLLRDPSNFPHGIYWCVRKGDEYVSPSVDILTRHSKFNLIEIENFDSFFAEVHRALQLELPDEMVNPYQAVSDKFNSLLKNANINMDDPEVSEIIKRDVGIVAKKIEEYSNNVGRSGKELPLPYRMLAEMQIIEGNKESALRLITKQLEENPSVEAFKTAFEIAALGVDPDSVDRFMNIVRYNKNVFKEDPNSTFSIAVSLMNIQRYREADEILELGYNLKSTAKNIKYPLGLYAINKALVLRFLDQSLPESLTEILNRLQVEGPILIRIGSSIVLGDLENAQNEFISLIKEGGSPVAIVSQPIFKLLNGKINNSELQDLLISKGVKFDPA